VTIQASLFYVLALIGVAGMALFPELAGTIARRMGFVLLANWFFAVAIAALSFLHLTALISLSRVETRSIVLTQELGILRERLDRALAKDRPPA
jgi:cbb3-type cytochrome oxidase subunit 1